MVKDLFSHLEENLIIKVQLLDEFGHPLILADHTVEFATSFELNTPTIEILTMGNGISVLSSTHAVIQIDFMPTQQAGYADRNLVYQLRTTDVNSGYVDVCLEGRIFITPSLFD